MRKSPKLIGKNIPYVEAAHKDGRQRPTAILLRTSWTTGTKGAAHGIAQAWHNPHNKQESCHYVVDEAQIIRCVPDKVHAFHTKLPFETNISFRGVISINVCHNPPMAPTAPVLFRVTQLTARLCRLYNIPIQIVDDDVHWLRRKKKSRGGIILKTVGEFPATEFLHFVKIEYDKFKIKD